MELKSSRMETNTKDSGKKTWRTALVSSLSRLGTSIPGISLTERSMVKDVRSSSVAMSTQVNGKTAVVRDKVVISSQLGGLTRVKFGTVSLMASDSWSGWTLNILESSRRVNLMALASWKRQMLSFTKVHSKPIWKTVLVDMWTWFQESSMRVFGKMIKKMGLVKQSITPKIKLLTEFGNRTRSWRFSLPPRLWVPRTPKRNNLVTRSRPYKKVFQVKRARSNCWQIASRCFSYPNEQVGLGSRLTALKSLRQRWKQLTINWRQRCFTQHNIKLRTRSTTRFGRTSDD